MKDKEVERLIKTERQRQKRVINLIASENYVSKDVLAALGSELTNKYAEGYPGARYYGGNEISDQVENLCKERALNLFKLSPAKWHINVQPLSGSPANLAVYLALVPPVGLGGAVSLKTDKTGNLTETAPPAAPVGKIMAMHLNHGGHLTHGHKVSVTGKLWNWVHYGVDRDSELLDYKALKELAKKEKPALIVTGYTAYPRIIDFKKFREIAGAACPESGRGAYLMVDMSHFAGLVAAGVYPSPFKYADVVTTTTHKTLRGPRAALVFSRKIHARQLPSVSTDTSGNASRGQPPRLIPDLIDRTVFPGLQGGPHLNQIAAMAVCLKEAATPAFKKYAQQVVKNARALADALGRLGWRVVSGGTDTHLLLVDTLANGISGKAASEALEREGIIVNKNTIPFDTRSPTDPSGIRLGTPTETTRGKKEKDFITLARRIDKILRA